MELYDRRNAPRRQDTWFVYGLVDSREPEEIRYIGITNDPRRRLSHHLSSVLDNSTHKARWVAKTVRDGGEILMMPLARGLGIGDAKLVECAEIASRQNLTNLTIGGDGISGCIFSQESRAKMSRARKLRKTSDETRSKMSASHAGKKKGAEHVAKCAATVRLRGPHVGPYKGVSFNKRSGMWVVNIGLDGKQKHIGYFTTPELAALAYDRAALEAWGGSCYLNFPVAMTASQEITING